MRVGRSTALIAGGCVCLLLIGVGLASGSGPSLESPAVETDRDVSGATAAVDATYGRNGTDRIAAAAETSDGGYLLTGQTESPEGDTDGWVIRVDADGSEVWNRTYGGTGFDAFRSVSRVAGGGYVLAGTSDSTADGSFDAWLVRIDADGDLVWAERYGGSRYEATHAVVPTDDGFALAGTTRSRGPGASSGWVLRVNATGSESWNRTYGGGSDDVVNDVTRTDTGFVLAGTTESATDASNAWVVGIDDDGSERWTHTISTGDATTGAAIATNGSGGYVVAGEVVPEGGGPTDALLTRVTADGSEAWLRTYGGGGSDTAAALVAHADGYAFAGGTESFGATARDAWIVNAGSDGEQRFRSTVSAEGIQTATGIGRNGNDYVLVGTSGAADSDGFLARVDAGSESSDEETSESSQSGSDFSSDDSQRETDDDDSGTGEQPTPSDEDGDSTTEDDDPDSTTESDEADDSTDSTTESDEADDSTESTTESDGEETSRDGSTVSETQGSEYLGVVVVVALIVVTILVLGARRR